MITKASVFRVLDVDMGPGPLVACVPVADVAVCLFDIADQLAGASHDAVLVELRNVAAFLGTAAQGGP